jgi:hypothetical protein
MCHGAVLGPDPGNQWSLSCEAKTLGGHLENRAKIGIQNSDFAELLVTSNLIIAYYEYKFFC